MTNDKVGASEARYVSSEDGALLCVFVPQLSSLSNGTFISRDQDSIQVGTFKYESPHLINRHKHNELPRVADRTQEFIFVLSGYLTARIFDDREILVCELTIPSGGGLLLLSGWHEFDIPESCHFLETKTGPYMGAADKTVRERSKC